MSDSVRPQRRQPTRLFCPWDSPGKNIGVGCHFLLQCVKVKLLSRARLSDPMDCSLPGSSIHAAAAKSLQPCPTLCNPIDGSPPGSPVPGILQARILEWVAISFSPPSIGLFKWIPVTLCELGTPLQCSWDHLWLSLSRCPEISFPAGVANSPALLALCHWACSSGHLHH